jgi:shikimate dehydrogenase
MTTPSSIRFTGSTKLCGVIGDPVAHSLSPLMQNAAMQALGLDWAYMPFHVKPEGLRAAIEGARALGIVGLNVTIPHKETVVALLDELDPLAEAIAAVNTIHFDAGRAKGYNTDAYGFTQSVLADGELEMAGATVLVLGGGGAARGLAAGAASEGAKKVILANRTRARAERIAGDLERVFPAVRWEVVQASATSLRNAAGRAQVVANATSLGMKASDELPIPADALTPGQVVFDSVYFMPRAGSAAAKEAAEGSPGDTALLRAARAAGCITVGGLAMLARQGAKSLAIWTGLEPDEDLMLSLLIKHVRES